MISEKTQKTGQNLRDRFTIPAFLLVALVLWGSLPGTRALADGGARTAGNRSPAPGEEYPVAYWAQTHVREALLLSHSLTSRSFGAACRTDHFSGDPAVRAAWIKFSKGPRRSFCSRYPAMTLHLLGEAPYFMLRPPGSHR